MARSALGSPSAPVGAARSRPLRRSRNIQRTARLRKPREAKSLPYGEESVVPYSGIVGVVGVVGIVGVAAGVVGAAAAGGIWKPRIFPLAEVSVTSPPMTLFL